METTMLSDDELECLRNPPQGLQYWDAKGAVAKLLAAGLLRKTNRTQYVPSRMVYLADFERTELGEGTIANEQKSDT